MFLQRTGGFCLCLVSALMVAVAVYAYTDDLAVKTVRGAALTDDCWEPCVDYLMWSIIECYDSTGERPCDTTKCVINTIKYLTCETTAAGSETQNCVVDVSYHMDTTQWNRWGVAREMACVDLNEWGYEYPDCEGSPYASESTPCKSNTCTGTLLASKALEFTRVVCGPKPPP